MPEIKIDFLGTGAGLSTMRAHTAMAVECPDGTKLLLDGSSGNSVLQALNRLGQDLDDYSQVLLSHHHADHMSGLMFVQFMRSQDRKDESPLRVFASEETVDGLRRLSDATGLSIVTTDADAARAADGRTLIKWDGVSPGRSIKLGPDTTARCFFVDHISGSVGWRVDSGGMSVVFSGDTRFSPNVVEASQGATLLIHEALRTDAEQEYASGRGHSTSGEAGRTAAEAGVSELVLTHLDDPFHLDSQPLIDDAKLHFEGPVTAAYDLYTHVVVLP